MKKRIDWRELAIATGWNLFGFACILATYLLFFVLLFGDEAAFTLWLRGAPL